MSDTPQQEYTLADIAAKLDTIGLQLNWMCENLTSLFAFVQQMSSNGGGIRGIMNALKQQQPQMTTLPEGATNE